MKPLNHGEVLDALTAAGLTARKNGYSNGEVLSITHQPVTLSVPRDSIKPSMLAPEQPQRPKAPCLVFDVHEPEAGFTGGDMYR
ncbi:hypothetical protein [Isoptericola sp. NPDC057191]|uniref:hypothetical protein n=1 Tax=Isoptericola sp. NPDC057191 TaxID=3346041 RepID=UPI003637FD5A